MQTLSPRKPARIENPIQMKLKFESYLGKFSKPFAFISEQDPDRARRDREYRERALRITRAGHFIPVYVIQAHPNLFRSGDDGRFALTAFTFDPDKMFDRDFMVSIVRKLQSMNGTKQADPELAAVAAIVSSPAEVYDRRILLPLSMTGGVPVYIGDVFLQRERLERGWLAEDTLTCVAEPMDYGGIELLPWWLVAGVPDPKASLESVALSPQVVIGIVAVLMTVVVVIVGLITYLNRPAPRTLVVKKPLEIEPGVVWHEVDLPGGDGTRTLWIYMPTTTPSEKIPCVFIAPAGTPSFIGNALGPFADGGSLSPAELEHIPYAKAGMAVVAYSLDGDVTEDDAKSVEGIVAGIKKFRDAHEGADDEKAAVDYALATYPQIDGKRLYTAGHSSAADAALIAAENDPRISGCIAYAPPCDISLGLDKDVISAVEGAGVADFDKFLVECSPATKASALRCPVFVFHADDDSTVPTSDVQTLLTALRSTNRHVTYSTTANGDHYDSMIRVGIPRAIEWLKSGMQTPVVKPIETKADDDAPPYSYHGPVESFDKSTYVPPSDDSGSTQDPDDDSAPVFRDRPRFGPYMYGPRRRNPFAPHFGPSQPSNPFAGFPGVRDPRPGYGPPGDSGPDYGPSIYQPSRPYGAPSSPYSGDRYAPQSAPPDTGGDSNPQ